MKTSVIRTLAAAVAIFVLSVGMAWGQDAAAYKTALESGAKKLADKDYPGARTDFETAIKQAPSGAEKAQAQVLIGHTYVNEKKWDDAVKAYEAGIAIEGIQANVKANAQMNTTGCLFNQQKWAEARASAEKLTKIEGASANFVGLGHLQWGQGWYFEGKFDEAIKELESVLAIDNKEPNNSKDQAQYFIGMCFEGKKDSAKALDAYQKVLIMDPVGEGVKKNAQAKVDALKAAAPK